MRQLTRWLMVMTLFLTQTAFAQVLEVQLYYVGPDQGSAWLGVQQGVTEANYQGEFLGQHYTIKKTSVEALSKLDSATAILVSADAATVNEVALLPQFANVPVINITADDDILRSECQPNLLSITASKKMHQDALKQWLAKHPKSKAVVQGWHSDFKKFAASQLNNRYRKATNKPMDDDAWAGWAAVKLMSDTVARTQNLTAPGLLNYLKNDIAFDGQKGVGSTFRDTGQLRQLLLIVENNKIVAEAPLRGVKGGLDSLGLKSCK